MTGRKGALSEIVINATDSLHSSRWFGKTLTNLQEDIKLSDDEGKYEPGTLEIISPPTALQSTKPALVTFRRVTNKYLDASNGQFLRYSDRKTRSVPEKHVIFLLHASEVDKSVGQGTLLQQIQDIKSCIGCPLQTTQESDWQFILLVQGLSAYARSEKRVQDDSNSRSCSYADIDQTLTELVVLERVFLIRSESGAETQRWLFELSIDIAYKPYK